MKEIKTSVIITSLICITLLEAFALYKGLNGVLLTTIVAVIAGIAGFIIPSPFKIK